MCVLCIRARHPFLGESVERRDGMSKDVRDRT